MTDTTTMPLDFTQFREQVSQSFVPLRVTSDRPERFRGDIRAAGSDDVHLSIVTAGEHTIERTT
jgi:hypothetical protein